jgi:hypothetical protein
MASEERDFRAEEGAIHLGGALASALSTSVDHLSRWEIPALPACSMQAPEKVELFAVHEVPLVQEANLPECCASSKEAGTNRAVDGSGLDVRGRAVIWIGRSQQSAAEASDGKQLATKSRKWRAGGLITAIRGEQTRPYDARPSALRGKSDECFDGAGKRTGIGVEREDVASVAHGDRLVDRGSVTKIDAVLQHVHRRKRRANSLRAAVARGVVDDPEVRAERTNRGRESLEALDQPVPRIPAHHNHVEVDVVDVDQVNAARGFARGAPGLGLRQVVH